MVTDDAQVPQEEQQVRVVAVAEERFRVGAEKLAVEVREDGDLVVATDTGDDRLDAGVGEGRVDVGGPLLGRRVRTATR